MANLGWGGVGNTLVAGGSDEESTSATPPQAAPPQAKGGEPPVPAWATPNAGSTSKGKGKKDSGREMSKDDGPPVIPAVVESPSASGIEPVQSKKQMNARMDDISRREYAVKQREEYVKELESRLKEGGIEIKPKNCEYLIRGTSSVLALALRADLSSASSTTTSSSSSLSPPRTQGPGASQSCTTT